MDILGTGNEHGGVILPMIAVATLVVWYFHFHLSQESENSSEISKQDMSTVSCCKNPDCVRCRRYRYVQERARRKLSWILRDLEARELSTFLALNRRIPDAISRSGTGNRNYHDGSHSRDRGVTHQPLVLQNPTVLMVLELPSKEIVTDWHRDACNYLKERETRSIVSEALASLGNGKIGDAIDGAETSSRRSPSSSSVVPPDDSEWTRNDSSGDWRVFQILNQGVWNPVLQQEDCGRNLMELVRGIPGLLEDSLLGNAFLSKIYPGTIIEPHCGPTNIRHRLQFLLKLPKFCDHAGNDNANQTSRLSLSVGRQKNIEWNKNKDTFVFDDSFVHSVTYREKPDGLVTASIEASDLRNKDSLARMVLIVDLWHPELQDAEISLLKDLYPPYSSS